MISTPNLYPVHLDPTQRESLEDITRNGSAPAKKIRHAQVLLLSDHNRPEGKLTGGQIAEVLGMHLNTVARIRKRFVLEGERPALERKRRQTPPTPPKIDGNVEAHLIAICCGPPPQGRARWTLKLLAGELTRRKLVVSISDEAVRKTLKKMRLSLGKSSVGAFPNGIVPASSPRWKRFSTSTPPSIPPRNP